MSLRKTMRHHVHNGQFLVNSQVVATYKGQPAEKALKEVSRMMLVAIRLPAGTVEYHRAVHQARDAFKAALREHADTITIAEGAQI